MCCGKGTFSGCPHPPLTISKVSGDKKGTRLRPSSVLHIRALFPPLSKKVVYFENHHLISVWSALSVWAEFSVQPLERSSAASTNHDLCANAQFVFYSPPVGNVLLFLFLQYSVWASLCWLMYKCSLTLWGCFTFQSTTCKYSLCSLNVWF